MKYGHETKTVEAFLRRLKRMTVREWTAAGAAVAAAGAAAAARDAARAAAWAANEIQGADLMRERNQPFYFLPLFGFADPEAVLAADHEPDAHIDATGGDQ